MNSGEEKSKSGKMIRCNPYGKYPKINKTAYIDAAAAIIGNVIIGENVFVGPGAVIRADEARSSVSVGNNCNIQDRVVIHGLAGSRVIIGDKTSLSHGCIIHGPCKIGNKCFIGFGSVVFRAVLEDNIFIKNLAVIEGVCIPNRKLVPNAAVVSSQKTVEALESISKNETMFINRVCGANLLLVKGYKKNA